MKPLYGWHGCLVGALVVGQATAYAANSGGGNLPSASSLQRLHDVLRAQPLAPVAVSLTLPELPPPTPSQVKEDTRVTLTGVEVQGVTLLKAAELAPLFEGISGQETSLAQIDKVVAAITQMYRDRGYFLSRAFLPPQEVVDGQLIVQVVEGRVDEVRVDAPEHVQRHPLVARIVERVRANPTLTSEDLETALLQLNDLPGISAQGRLAPASTQGGAILTMAITEYKGDVTAGFSNHGTRFIGPNRFELGTTVHNLISPMGDTLAVQALQDPNGSDLTLVDGTYSLPLNSHGTRAALNVSRGISRPEWTLKDLDVESRTVGANVTLEQNLLRSRALSWDVYGTLDWNDAQSTSRKVQLSADHNRTVRAGMRTRTADGWQGFTHADMRVSHGLDVLGATQTGQLNASRLRGTGTDFTKVNVDVSRMQYLNETWNVLLAGTGQFSTHALLAGEEFGLGGPSGFGRGYDSNELTGDHGIAAKAELQATFPVTWPWLDAWQLFGFYDFGAVWNKDRDVLEDNTAVALSSVGTGVRLQFSPKLNAEIMLAKPTTRDVQSNGSGNGTIYFRLSSKIDFATLARLHTGERAE